MEVFHSGSPLVFAMFLVAMSARIPSQVASEAFFPGPFGPGTSSRDDVYYWTYEKAATGSVSRPGSGPGRAAAGGLGA